MLNEQLLRGPQYWLIIWVIEAVCYYFLLKKMGLKQKKAIIPYWAEHEMATVLFRKTRSFWRPFTIAAVFVAGAYYLGHEEGLGYIYMLIAGIVYGLFQIRLYWRTAKGFGKGVLFRIFMVLVPVVGMLILSFGKSQFTRPVFKPERNLGAFYSNLRKLTVGFISAVELIVLIFGVGFLTFRTLPPRAIANSILNDVYDQVKDIESDGKALTREDTMGEAAASVEKMPVSREKFFPDHSGDKNVVVMEYVIGSNLENAMGMATANIRMMKDATKKGDALTFVLEAGGSKRWFTPEITEEAYGRYTIKGGKVEKAMDLDIATMESPAELTEFIKWTKENYPADRYMLVLWDHGGGVAYGYGVDNLHHREDTTYQGFNTSEVVESIKNSGVKFDVIGFDACLMQDIEIARALEPYADYYLASEETEGGYGWFYTSAFGKLAANPGLSSEEFGKDIVSSYDQMNTIIKEDGEPDSSATLSFVDLTRVDHAYDKVEGLLEKTDAAIRADQKDFAEFGLAAMNSYTFIDKLQLDLVDLIDKLEDTDLDNSICSSEERTEAINAVKACVVYRNKDSAEGINGMALALPYQDISLYKDTASQLDELDASKQKTVFNDIFSIIAVQKKAEHEEKQKKHKDNSFISYLSELTYTDYTKAEWYVKGFEDYEPTATLVDIPLKDTGAGWIPQLPDKTWDIIADSRTAVYQKAEDGRLRFLGYDHIGDNDENGHPMVDVDDMWIHINGHLAYYEAQPVRETEDGFIFSGDSKARLNGQDDIIIHIEWGPAKDDDEALKGRIIGYDYADDEVAFMTKGMEQFKAGDKIEFLFDYYDEEGNLVSTEPYGSTLRVVKKNSLVAEDQPLPEGKIQFLGVLTDVYQRELMTEVLEGTIGD